MKWHKWTSSDETYLKANWQNFSNQQIADHLGVTVGACKKKARSFKLVKSKETISAILKGKPNSGQFKSGNAPLNTKFDYYITTRLAKDGRKYKWIRISSNNWQLLHIYNWLEAGKSYDPKQGDILRFVDGNTLSTDIKNLALINREINLEKNRIPRRTALEIAIAKREKEKRIAIVKRQFKKEKKKVQRISVHRNKKVPVKPTIVNTQPRRTIQQPVFKSKIIDYSKLISVRIDKRTVVYAKPGEDINEVRKNYIKKYKTCHV